MANEYVNADFLQTGRVHRDDLASAFASVTRLVGRVDAATYLLLRSGPFGDSRSYLPSNLLL